MRLMMQIWFMTHYYLMNVSWWSHAWFYLCLLFYLYIHVYIDRLTLDLEGLVLTRPFPENTAMGLLDEIWVPVRSPLRYRFSKSVGRSYPLCICRDWYCSRLICNLWLLVHIWLFHGTWIIEPYMVKDAHGTLEKSNKTVWNYDLRILSEDWESKNRKDSISGCYISSSQFLFFSRQQKLFLQNNYSALYTIGITPCFRRAECLPE